MTTLDTNNDNLLSLCASRGHHKINAKSKPHIDNYTQILRPTLYDHNETPVKKIGIHNIPS